MIDGEEGGTADDDAPSSLLAVEGTEEEAAEEILFGEGREGDGHDDVGDAEAVEPGHGHATSSQSEMLHFETERGHRKFHIERTVCEPRIQNSASGCCALPHGGWVLPQPARYGTEDQNSGVSRSGS